MRLLLSVVVFCCCSPSWGQLICSEVFERGDAGYFSLTTVSGQPFRVGPRLSEGNDWVLQAIAGEARAFRALDLRHSHERALRFLDQPSNQSLTQLEASLEPLIWLAVRPVAHRISSQERYQELLQTARLGLVSELVGLQQIELGSIESLSAWKAFVSVARDSVFSIVRREIGRDFAIQAKGGDQVSFEEAVLLLGDSPQRATWLSEVFGKSESEILAEKQLQDSVLEQASSGTELVSVNSVDNTGISQRQKETVDLLLAGLDKTSKTVVQAAFFEGQSHDSIAETYGVSRQAITKMIKKSLHRMREQAERLSPVQRQQVFEVVRALDRAVVPSSAMPREYWDPTFRRQQRESRLKKEVEALRERDQRRLSTPRINNILYKEAKRREQLVQKVLQENSVGFLAELVFSQTLGHSQNKAKRSGEPKFYLHSRFRPKGTINESNGLGFGVQIANSLISLKSWIPLMTLIQHFIVRDPVESIKRLDDLSDSSLQMEFEQQSASLLRKIQVEINRAKDKDLSFYTQLNQILEIQNNMSIRLQETFDSLYQKGLIERDGRIKENVETDLSRNPDIKVLDDFYSARVSFMEEILNLAQPLLKGQTREGDQAWIAFSQFVQNISMQRGVLLSSVEAEPVKKQKTSSWISLLFNF